MHFLPDGWASVPAWGRSLCAGCAHSPIELGPGPEWLYAWASTQHFTYRPRRVPCRVTGPESPTGREVGERRAQPPVQTRHPGEKWPGAPPALRQVPSRQAFHASRRSGHTSAPLPVAAGSSAGVERVKGRLADHGVTRRRSALDVRSGGRRLVRRGAGPRHGSSPDCASWLVGGALCRGGSSSWAGGASEDGGRRYVARSE